MHRVFEPHSFHFFSAREPTFIQKHFIFDSVIQNTILPHQTVIEASNVDHSTAGNSPQHIVIVTTESSSEQLIKIILINQLLVDFSYIL